MRLLFLIVILTTNLQIAHSAQISDISEHKSCEPESDVCVSTLTIIFVGADSIELKDLLGPFYLSTINNQVLDCGGNPYRSGPTAHIIQSTGHMIVINNPGIVADCGLVNESKLYWVAYEIYDSSGDGGHILLYVYDREGILVVEKISDSSGDISFEYQGEILNVHVEQGV